MCNEYLPTVSPEIARGCNPPINGNLNIPAMQQKNRHCEEQSDVAISRYNKRFFQAKQRQLKAHTLNWGAGFGLVVPKSTPGLAGGKIIAFSEECRRQEKSSPL